ncbi:hypothetical protein ACFQ61_10535 [Streptomyces sp. NPDC056500]|uniref:hypothetical protein n=1 Tax=Streptomyces sp. NPDC056500 TaxID=3345840 RepID=UPI0036BBCA29
MALGDRETDTGRSARIRRTSTGFRAVRRLLAQLLALVMVLLAFSAFSVGGQRAQAAPMSSPALTPTGEVVARASGCSGRPAKTVRFSTGELRVYRSHRYACAITIAKRPGVRRAMSVSLQPRGGRAVVDEGRYTRKAGPVTVHALNRCVRATGRIAGVERSTGWILC